MSWLHAEIIAVGATTIFKSRFDCKFLQIDYTRNWYFIGTMFLISPKTTSNRRFIQMQSRPAPLQGF